ncbi:monocarboxylate transporter 9-like [Musca vetustissima]|uniref:monocarboxylate transporter 9-like n=1 Tax=Musca vetustissima TaxID=27455 RepID=UPI002AB75D7F|nr:monocarboxylate transporter 9-like [Musca vetustissima]
MTEEKSRLHEPTANATVCIQANNNTKKSKRKHRDKSDLGPNFVAPDGGWGWVVCIAAGLSNLSVFPPLQQYGLIYRRRMEKFQFDAKEITTIINVEMAVASMVGLVNGAMFRRFTFRQVGLVGSLFAFSGIFFTTFCDNFWKYLVCFSSIYGIGRGLTMAANSLAVNTYFKNKRRRATGFTWTITGLGPIIFPYVSTIFLGLYGPQGSILIYSAIALHAFMCSLTLQPVLWHSPKPSKEEERITEENNGTSEIVGKCKFCQNQKQEELEKSEYEVTEPGTPMVARANDGWYGSKLSLNKDESRPTRRFISKQNNCESGYELGERIKKSPSKATNLESVMEATHCTCAEEKALLEKNSNEEKEKAKQNALLEAEGEEKEAQRRSHLSVLQKIVLFFDLDLLKDFTFVNLAVGMTIMMFGEFNFSVLTPFILNNFGYNDKQISIAMSCLAGMDISVRFLAPLVLEKVKLSNSLLFAFGILAVSIGRFIVTQTDSYYVVVAAFIFIGFGKGFRTIFSPLIIPSYVPLKRLPAASGLQLILSSITSFSLGPVLGTITDKFGYTVTIHSINALTGLMLLFWLLEYFIRRNLKNKSPQIDS